MRHWTPLAAALIVAVALVGPACGFVPATQPKIGSPQNPIKMSQVPFIESQKLLTGMQPFVDAVEKETGYKIESTVANSYAAVIEAMGSEKVDIAWLATFAYVLARQKFQVEIIASSINRSNQQFYKGFIITRTNTGINSLADLKGKRFGWVDPSSASGYLYPAALLIDKVGYNPKDPKGFLSDQVYAGGHDKVLIALMSEQIDAGAIFDDARDNKAILGQWPDIMEKTKIIAETERIPNDTVSIRKGLPDDVKKKLRDAFMKIANSDAGKKILNDSIGTNGLGEATDADYEPVRQAARALNMNLEEELAKPR